MTVKELIKELELCNPEMEVRMQTVTLIDGGTRKLIGEEEINFVNETTYNNDHIIVILCTENDFY